MILCALVYVAANANASELDFSGLHSIAPSPVAAAQPLDLSCLDELCASHATREPAKPASKPTAKKPAAKKPAAKPVANVGYRWELRCQNGQCYRVLVRDQQVH
jgi:hypothetical protein